MAKQVEPDKVEQFIRNRFQTDCKWLTGNCYYFAVILKARFSDGEICYDVLDGHFLLRLGGCYYDYTGKVVPKNESRSSSHGTIFRSMIPCSTSASCGTA